MTLTTGVPVTTSDVTSATTVYYTPNIHNIIALWDSSGSVWSNTVFTEQTLALGTITSGLPYDVFGFLSSGVLNIEKLAWTNGTTRATAITIQDGRYCKSGDKTRLYLGTFYTTSTTTTADSSGGATTQVGGKRFLWNMYNRVARPMSVVDTTDNWSYTSNTWRQANAATGNKVEFISGLGTDAVVANVSGTAYTYNNVSFGPKQAVGVDSTSALGGICSAGYNQSATPVYASFGAAYIGNPGAGYHYLAWIERGGDGNCLFIGDNGGDMQTGLVAKVFA